MDNIESPVLDSMDSVMQCGLLTNAKGDLLILHDRPLAADVQWVEFHKDTGELCIIYDSGQSESLGLSFDGKTISNISNGMEVNLLHLDEEKLVSRVSTVLTIHE